MDVSSLDAQKVKFVENRYNVNNMYNELVSKVQNIIPENIEFITTATNNTVDSDITNSLTSEGNRQTNDNRNRNETSEQTIKNVEDYLQHVKGKRGGITYSKMLEEYRKTFLNIDMQVINELKDLFMNIW